MEILKSKRRKRHTLVLVTDTHGNGLLWVDGISNKALDFDGSNDFILIPDDESLDFGAGDFTIECWIKTTQSYFNRYGYILNKEPWSIGLGFHLYLHPAGVGEFQIYGQNNYGVQVNTITISNDGVWHHIAAARNGNNIEIFVDGTFEATQDCSGVSSVDNSIPFEIGQRAKGTGSDGNFDGIIDEVVLHNKALEPEEFYGMQYMSYMAAMWPLDEGEGTIAYDQTYNNNDGTLTNGPTWGTGISGNALDFDGQDDYVEVPHDNSLNFGDGDFTVECWIKTNVQPATPHPTALI